MTTSPEPDPSNNPPVNDQAGGEISHVANEPNMGPVSGNRTPMILFLGALGIIVLLVAGLVVASLLGS